MLLSTYIFTSDTIPKALRTSHLVKKLLNIINLNGQFSVSGFLCPSIKFRRSGNWGAEGVEQFSFNRYHFYAENASELFHFACPVLYFI